MMTQISESLYEVVVNLRAGRDITDDKLLHGEVTPAHHRFLRKRMPFGKHDKHPFEPKLVCFTPRPDPCAGQERDVDLELTHRRDMFVRISFDELYVDLRMGAVVSEQQIRQKA